MDFSLYSISSKLFFLYLLYRLIYFIKLYINGRRTGFPVYIVPLPTKTIPWLVLAPALRHHLERYLPGWIYERLDVTIHGWEFQRKAEMHRRLGKAFAVVSLDECSLWVADPAAGTVILQRRKDFLQSPLSAKIVGLLGPNVIGANGEDWQRQRRVVAPNLNERISETVWNESCQQAGTMLEYLEKNPGGETLDGLRSIAINVIGQAGFGQYQPWSPDVRSLAENAGSKGGRAAYFGALSLVTDKIVEAALVSPKFLQMGFMPSATRLLGHHMENIPQYVTDMLEEERGIVNKGSGPRSNFLSMLVQLSDKEKGTGSSGTSLTEDEISGNLFAFTAAGFDTTANTMGYAVIVLAAYPEWQDWIREELHNLKPDISTGKYEEVFPRCQRVLALMLETLRHFPPVSHSTRHVSEPQQFTDSSGTHMLNPPMDVYVSHQSIHCDPEIWGPDVLDFDPTRWIDKTTGQVITPPKGTYLPWSGGPRVCPGIKMSQVEFVATLATLFRSGRCEPLPSPGREKPEEMRQRLRELMADSISKLTLQVRNPKEVRLRWVRDA